MKYVLLGMLAAAIFAVVFGAVAGFPWWGYPINWAVSCWMAVTSFAAWDEAKLERSMTRAWS